MPTSDHNPVPISRDRRAALYAVRCAPVCVKGPPMDFKELLRKGLLGYQPMFFPNGVITGTGYQFFGNLRQAGREKQFRAVAENESQRFNPRRLGNLYVPPDLGSDADYDTDCYFRIEADELPQFVADNLRLQEVYRHFVRAALAAAGEAGCPIGSMIEIGSNTCLFPLEFARAGVPTCHGADIVDYSDVVSGLAALHGATVNFHPMRDDSDDTWRALPKADIVWSYAVLLHQANPLAHLTRLASLARRAIFVMTNCGDDEDWRSDEDLAIRYRSANSYYAAAFPNCFDISIVSPALVRFSLQRLGFSRVIELGVPNFPDDTPEDRKCFADWMKLHRCFLAFRDTPLADDALDDYSVESERSPYNGQDVRAYRGNHNNIFLRNGRYFIVPHSCWLAENHAELRSFAHLSNAIAYLHDLPEELKPYAITVREGDTYLLKRYRNRFYFFRKADDVDLSNTTACQGLHVLDSVDQWDRLLSYLSPVALASLPGTICDFINDFIILHRGGDDYSARRISPDGVFDAPFVFGASAAEVRQHVVATALLDSLEPDGGCVLYTGADLSLVHLDGDFVVRMAESGKIISRHRHCEDAWHTLLAVRAPETTA